jgi:hypothetical protein
MKPWQSNYSGLLGKFYYLLNIIKPFTPLLPSLLAGYRSNLIEKAFDESKAGEITLAESIYLGKMVRELTGEGPLVEIGTLFGRSTLVMTANKTAQRLLFTVDNYSWNPLGLASDVHFRITKNILFEAEKKFGVKVLRMDKADFYQCYQGPPPALVFIDAIHTWEETRADITWAKEVKAGVICGHDYKESCAGVVKAVDDFGGPKDITKSLWVL